MPVRKDAAALLAAGARDTALTDAACLVFMGTTVISGSALAVVIATGRSALFGGLSRAFQWQRPRTRFERGMNSTSWMLMAFTAVTVPVSMLVTGIASGDWLQALLFGVSVAVGLTPEMLPLIVTVCLSRGARTMASGKAIVRRLDAIETLGGMDVLCVDKTGTLTSGVIKLDRAQSMSGLNSSYVLHAAWLTTLIPHTTSNPWMTPSSQPKVTRQTIPATYRSREARLSIRYDAGRPSSSRRAITARTASTQVAAISVRPAAPAPERPGTSAASWSSRAPSPKCCPAATPSCAMEPQSR